MSSTDPMKEDSSTRLETMQRISQVLSHSPLTPDIKSLSSTKQTIPRPTYSSSLERLLRSSQETADSSSPAIIRIKSSNRSSPGVLSLNLPSKVKKSRKSRLNSLTELTGSLTANGFKVIRKFLPN